jgi:hypothetical protein
MRQEERQTNEQSMQLNGYYADNESQRVFSRGQRDAVLLQRHLGLPGEWSGAKRNQQEGLGPGPTYEV